MKVYLVCSAVLVLLYFVLAANVSRMRGKTRTGIGSGDDPSGPLNKAVRAHGNAAEYTPVFLVLFLFFHLTHIEGWVMWMVIIVTISRVLHALGMLMTPTFNAPPHPLRAVGSLGTYVGGISLGVQLLLPGIL